MTLRNISSQAAPAVYESLMDEFVKQRKHEIADALDAARGNHNPMAEPALEIANLLFGNLVYVDGEWWQGWLDDDATAFAWRSEPDAERAVQGAMLRLANAERFFTPKGVRDTLYLVRPWLAIPEHLIPIITELSDPGE